MTFFDTLKTRLTGLSNNPDTPFFALLAQQTRSTVVEADFTPRPVANDGLKKAA